MSKEYTMGLAFGILTALIIFLIAISPLGTCRYSPYFKDYLWVS